MCKMTIALTTLGCKVNFYETEKISERFRKDGWEVVGFNEIADVYLVNTCTVTNIAERKSRKMIHRAKKRNPNALVAAIGCYIEAALERLDTEVKVDIRIGNDQKDRVVEMVNEAVASRKRVLQKRTGSLTGMDGNEEETTAAGERNGNRDRTRAFVKIQDGCNQFCSYCIIPYVRGRIKSKPIKDVVEEIKGLVDRGYKELVLSGIHLSSYGVDLTGSKNFMDFNGEPLLDLLDEISHLEGLLRIRLGSLEPRLITEDFIRRFSSIPKVCPHFHLSLQSGCDDTLRRMNRKYTTADYEKACGHIRGHMADPAITTDVIVGFPGETEDEFEETLRFVEKIGFARIHVFPYSVRAGTKAEGLPGHVPSGVKKERSQTLLQLEELLRHTYMESFIGKRQQVLIEEKRRVGGGLYYLGHNERYVRMAVKAEEYKNDGNEPMNEMVWVAPSHFLDSDTLFGDVWNNRNR